jgi:hypothetical protein
MNFTELLSYLFPYMSGIRKVKQYVSIDLVFPTNWTFPTEIVEKTNVVQNENYKGSGTFLSFVAEPDEKLEQTIETIFELIGYNLERQEKEILLKNKIQELKQIFESSKLNDLQNLKFELPYDDYDLLNSLEDEQEEV